MLSRRPMALAFSTALLISFSASALGADFTLPIVFPNGLTWDGTHLIVSDDVGWRDLKKVDPATGTIAGTIPLGGSPRDIVYDGAGSIFASDMNGLVRRIDAAGTPLGSFPLPFRGGAIAWDGSTLFVGDIDSSWVERFTSDGTSLGGFFAEGIRPEGMVFDPETGNLWVITINQSEIFEMTPTGAVVRACQSAFVPGPYGIGGITLIGSTLWVVGPVGGDPFAGAHLFSIDRASLVCDPPLTTVAEVSIDVLQGAIAAPSRGRIGVAISSDGAFDAAAVDASTLRFGPTGTEAAALNTWLEDLDGDGDLDRVAQFGVVESGIGCSTETVFLAGSTTSGGEFRGSDTVRVVGCR